MWAAYQKGTTENVILKSICYSAGKNIALKCPFPFTPENRNTIKGYWYRHCDLFIRHCAKHGIVIDKTTVDFEKYGILRGMTASGYIRHRMRDGFKKVTARHKVAV